MRKRGAVAEHGGSKQSKRVRPGDYSGTGADYSVGFSAMDMEGKDIVEIDEDLHSRQLAVYGRETMRRMFGANILISGMGGLGVEIAKNVILAGVKSLTIHDCGVVEVRDLSSQFYLTEADVGKNTALACVEKLLELNNAVTISVITTQLTEESLSNFQVVVFTSISLSDAIKFDNFCHNHNPPISFIKADVRGVFGNVFCDFGPEFTVVDVNGEEPHTGIIASISNDNPAVVSCVEDENLEFQDGDVVVFSEVKGMVEMSDGKPRKIKTTGRHSFTLEEDTNAYSPYEKGGIVTQVKQPKVLKFKRLEEAILCPEFLEMYNGDRPLLLHLAFRSLDQFIAQTNRLPAPASEEDASVFIQIAKTLNDNSRLESIDESILTKFASGSSAVLSPMAAVFGGIVGQEVVKACSGKFHPVFQFFYFDSVESLPSQPLEPEDVKPLGRRYDAQISVFGREIQQKLENLSVFVVGAGALGCEFLKNLALMGVACGGGNAKVTVTDDDVIEKSNLSRQFLFRDSNIGQAKSTVASRAALGINPTLGVEAFQNRVGPETENVFDDGFWEGVDVVINALDNVNARLYVDARAVYFNKPLLESGTLGPKCSTQVVIPHLTENYGASADPPEKQAPMCTLHSFPHNIDHCLTWARSEFEGLLDKTPQEANAFLSNPEEYEASKKKSGDSEAQKTLELVVECLVTERCVTFEDCLVWARKKFEEYFANRVKQLTYTFPEDALTSSGAPFWSAPKRFPKPLTFSSSDASHLALVAAAAILCAEIYGIPKPFWVQDPTQLAEAVDKIELPGFQPKIVCADVNNDEATADVNSARSTGESSVIEQLASTLKGAVESLLPGFRMIPIQFEKDDDTNYHMELIAGLANMRARNYGIQEVDKLKAKLIAGRIVPAIATSTALATGLVCLELYKVVQGNKKREEYRSSCVNLALPMFSRVEPLAPRKSRHGDMEWSVWDRWVIQKDDLTIGELLEWFQAKKLRAYSISCGQSLLYTSLFPAHEERINTKVWELARDVAKLELPPSCRHFDVVVACEDENGDDLDVPLVSIRFR